jgi:hypothetical protein
VAGAIDRRRIGVSCALSDASIRWRGRPCVLGVFRFTQFQSARRLTLTTQGPFWRAVIGGTQGSKVTLGAFAAQVTLLITCRLPEYGPLE